MPDLPDSLRMESASARTALAAAIAFVVGLLLMFGLQHWLNSTKDMDTSRSYGDWRLTCAAISTKDSNCALIGDVFNPNGSGTLLRIAYTETDGSERLSATLPHGVLLPPGLAIQFGKDKPVLLQYETCDLGGCEAFLPLDKVQNAAKDPKADVKIIVAGGDGKAVGIPFSLRGFNDGIDAIQAQLRRRHAWWRFVLA